MSVLTQLNLSEGSWSVNELIDDNLVEYKIGFLSDSDVTSIQGLQFDISVTVSGEAVFEAHHPQGGVAFVETDQEWLIRETISLSYDDEVTVSLSVSHDGSEYSHEHTFLIPRPEAPFASWVWDGEGWNAPSPYPGDDTYFYNWDEETTSWVLDPDA